MIITILETVGPDHVSVPINVNSDHIVFITDSCVVLTNDYRVLITQEEAVRVITLLKKL